jgi:hypothetical protein
MKYSRRSVTAIVMIMVAILGWLISLTGLLGIWTIYPSITSSISNTILFANRSLDTSLQLLDGIDATLKTASEAVTQIQTGLVDVSKTFGNTSPMFGSAANMVGKDFTKMVEDSRVALLSLANSAKVLDDTLRFISSFPLIGQSYNPPVPLDTSINNLASSIETLPSNLKDIQTWLDGTGKDLATLKEDTAQLAKSVEKISPQLATAIQVEVQYRQLVQELKTGLTGLETRLYQGSMLLAVSLSIFLIWLAIAQVPNFLQGLERLQASQMDENLVVQENLVVEETILENSETPMEKPETSDEIK